MSLPANVIASLSPDSAYVRQMAEGFLFCHNCQQQQSLTPNLVAEYFAGNWPICCPETLKGGTMHYYHDEQQLRKEQQNAGE